MPAPGTHARWAVPPALAALLIVAFAARLPNLDGSLTDLDAWRQTDTASIAHHFLSEPNILYPRVFWGAPGPGYVEAEFQLYPFVASLIYRVFGENPLYGRLLSILMTLGAMLILFRIARRWLPPWPSLLAAAFMGFAPIVFRYSRQFMPEATVLFFYLLALERFLAYLDDDSWNHLLQAGAANCLAILVKPTSIHIGLAMIILAALRFGPRFWMKPKLIAFAAISLIPSALYYFHAMNIYFTYGNTFGVIAGGDSKWTSAQQLASPSFYKEIAMMNTTWMLGIAGVLAALGGLVAWKRTGWRALIIAWGISFAIYCLVLGRSTGDYGRGLQYHIFSAPLISLAAAGGLAALLSRRHWANCAAAIVVVALILLPQAKLDYWVLTPEVDQAEYAAGLRLAELSAPEETVVVLSRDKVSDNGRANNYEDPRVFFYAKRWGRSLGRDQQNPGDFNATLGIGAAWYVNFTAFNDLAEDDFLPEVQRLAELADSGDGYQIYRILHPQVRKGEKNHGFSRPSPPD